MEPNTTQETSETPNVQEAQAAPETQKKKLSERIGGNLLILYVKTALLIIGGQLFGSALTNLAFIGIMQISPAVEESDAWITAISYVYFIGIWMLLLLILFIFRKNRPILKEIWTQSPGNTWKLLLIGLLVGFALNSVCVLAAWLHGDISLTFDSFHPVSFLLIFVTVFVQSSAEEVLCRGYLYQRLRMNYSHPAVAIIGNSLLFALLHLMNEGVTILSILNIFTIGILLSLCVYYLDSLWCAFAIHAAWNFTQNILFGLPNSGIVMPYSVFKLDAASARDSFAYNVGFGIEGTLLADILLILACIALLIWGRKHKKAI